MAITIDIGIKERINAWNQFISYVYNKYPNSMKDYYAYRHIITKELTPYKATWVTDDITYSKLIFESEQYKTLFFLRWQ